MQGGFLILIMPRDFSASSKDFCDSLSKVGWSWDQRSFVKSQYRIIWKILLGSLLQRGHASSIVPFVVGVLGVEI